MDDILTQLKTLVTEIDGLTKSLPTKVSDDARTEEGIAFNEMQEAKNTCAAIEAIHADDVCNDDKYGNDTKRKAQIDRRCHEDQRWKDAAGKLRDAISRHRRAERSVVDEETDLKARSLRLTAANRKADLLGNYLYLQARKAELEAARIRAGFTSGALSAHKAGQ